MRVVVHVDELVLDGFAERDSDTIAAAVQQRLAALLTAAPPAWSNRDRIDAGAFAPATTAPETGARIAGTVYGALFT